MGVLRTLLVVLLLTPSLLALNIQFNNSLEGNCQVTAGGCDWSLAHLWDGGAAPGLNDTVTVTGLTGGLLLVARSNVQIFILFLNNAALTVDAKTNFTVSGVVVGVNATLNVTEHATIRDIVPFSHNLNDVNAGQFTIAPLGTLVLEKNATLSWAIFNISGNAQFGEGSTLSATSAFWGPSAQASFANSAPTFLSLTVLSGGKAEFPFGLMAKVLVAENNSLVTITTSTSAFSGSITVGQAAVVSISGGEVYLLDTIIAGGNRYPALAGTGTLTITDPTLASVTFGSPSLFNGNVTLVGTVVFQAANVTLPNLGFSDGATVTIRGDGLILSGTVTVPGSLVAQANNGITVAGTVIVKQSVSVESGSSLIVTGALVILSSPLSLSSGSLVLLDGLLHSNVTVPEGAELRTTGPNAQIVGSVINTGLVTVSTANTLEIFDGDYSQHHNASIHVTLSAEGDATLVVNNGSIFLNNGTIQYSITDKPFLQSADFLVATANVSVNGTFTSDATSLSGSKIDRSLPVKYSDKAIYIDYNFNISDVDVWMWVVLAVAIVVILIATVAIIVKCRARSQYQRVDH